ncbi:11706_t:CDS:2 [Funneliformis caledonium]|uniref:11706_t:CDS:1 n=1 Tax=Funneliformis caledonium TaxID=1117310 RepID=A0A9N9CL01_9GLOM|nr:11706_t:CDS:2 [Funneliformis caledonium]
MLHEGFQVFMKWEFFKMAMFAYGENIALGFSIAKAIDFSFLQHVQDYRETMTPLLKTASETIKESICNNGLVGTTAGLNKLCNIQSRRNMIARLNRNKAAYTTKSKVRSLRRPI